MPGATIRNLCALAQIRAPQLPNLPYLRAPGRVGKNYITYGDIKSISGSAPLLKKCRFERNFCSGLTFHTGEKERENPDRKRENPAF